MKQCLSNVSVRFFPNWNENCVDQVIGLIQMINYILQYNKFTSMAYKLIVERHSDELDNIVIVSPDAGAEKKIYKTAKNLNN